MIKCIRENNLIFEGYKTTSKLVGTRKKISCGQIILLLSVLVLFLAPFSEASGIAHCQELDVMHVGF